MSAGGLAPTSARSDGCAHAAESLGLGADYDEFLAELDIIEPDEELALPGADEARETLRSIGCPSVSVEAAVASLPGRADTALRWLLERCRARLVRGLGDPGAPRGHWPQLPGALGPAGDAFYLHLVLATLPATLAFHRERGVPRELSEATLADIGRHARIREAAEGRAGVDEPWWITLHLRGILYEIGRLQYSAFDLGSGPEHPEPWYDEQEQELLGDGFRLGDPALGVHIPAGDPLSPERCEHSMRAAAAFFEEFQPVAGRRLATCSSWLLDDQLEGLLPRDSNILAFQRSFRLVPGFGDGDAGVQTFVFRSHAPLEELEATTSLQRRVLEHWRAGRHFRWRTGWRDLPESRAR